MFLGLHSRGPCNGAHDEALIERGQAVRIQHVIQKHVMIVTEVGPRVFAVLVDAGNLLRNGVFIEALVDMLTSGDARLQCPNLFCA